MPYVFSLDHDHDTPPRELKHLLGSKGADLAEMTSVLGLAVPPGFTLTTEACRSIQHRGESPEGLEDEVRAHISQLEQRTERRLGSAERPLVLSVRAGAAVPMPAALSSVLNIGLNDETVEYYTGIGKERFILDTYRRLIQMYGEIVMGVPGDAFENRLEGAKLLAGIQHSAELPTEVLRLVVERFKGVVESVAGEPFPQDPYTQLRGAIWAVFDSWDSPAARTYRSRERIPHELGTAITVQRMVFGNRDEQSGTGIAFSRNPRTGAKELVGEFNVSGQGEDVAGSEQPSESLSEMATHHPDAHDQLGRDLSRLEQHYGDMMSVEFTVEQNKLWFLQAGIGDRSGVAAVRIATALVNDDDLGLAKEHALLTVSGDHIDQILHPQFDAPARTPLASGLGASPGAAVGKVFFSPDAAVDAYDMGDDVILVKDETSPEDVHGMAIAEGILTSKGGLASHAAVVARGWGKPAVCGVEALSIGADQFTVGDVVVREGDLISLDGASGEVYLGAVDLSEGETPAEMDTVLGWADEVRAGVMGVRANADTPEDARRARAFGAEGIGLCRTEHQFLGERLPIVQRMILAGSPDEEAAALEVLGQVQRDDFIGLLEAMDGLPVTVRLLDPPLHEFLPDVHDLLAQQASGAMSDDDRRLLAAALDTREENPMMGTRGVRLGVVREGLFRMQGRALAEAVVARRADGGDPQLEVMVPLIINRAELELVRLWIEEEIASVAEGAGHCAETLAIRVGTMIETPRAAVCAAAIAPVADFFSFGTNDLTQMTLGFSRDDVESRFMRTYLERGLLGANPFETIDRQGVGALVTRAASDAREAAPDLKIGVCGEHGGDPASIELFSEAGLDYVSCSPYRVPVARLAAAHAIVRGRS